MTMDAFYKAEELNKELEAIQDMKNIISNSTLARDNEYYAGHNKHVIDDEMILCYMFRERNDAFQEKADVKVFGEGSRMKPINGKYVMEGNYIYGKDIPIGLVEALETALQKYEDKIRKEFEKLSDDYVNEDK